MKFIWLLKRVYIYNLTKKKGWAFQCQDVYKEKRDATTGTSLGIVSGSAVII